jgi:HSP20 family protein
MVERSQTGWLPQMYEPLHKLREKVKDWFAPKADGAVVEDGYEISLELPGVPADNVEILVQDGMLAIQGEKQFEREEQGRTFFFCEREYGAFQRSFRLPTDASTDGIDAVFKNGVLTLKIPKVRAVAADSRRVAIRTE